MEDFQGRFFFAVLTQTDNEEARDCSAIRIAVLIPLGRPSIDRKKT